MNAHGIPPAALHAATLSEAFAAQDVVSHSEALDALLADLAAAERREEQLREAHLKVEDGMIVLYVNGEPDTNYGFGLGLGQVIDRVAALADVGGEQQGGGE